MEFYLAPVGRGKTDAVLARIFEAKERSPFGMVWVLLATSRQTLDFRRRLLTPDERVFFNIETFTFYGLYERLLMMAGKPQRRLSDPARMTLIGEILRDLSARGDLPIFAPIAHTPGLARILLNFIYELKQSLIDVDAFSDAARRLNLPKAVELARIYEAYQRILIQHDLVDREGEGWLALSALAEDETLGTAVDLLVCDGYDQFNLLQSRLLVQLSTRTRASLTTLTTVPDREDTVGLRFKRALERLLTCCGEENVYPDLHWELFNTDAIPRPGGEPLAALAEGLFHPAAKPIHVSTDVVTRIEAPDPASESAAIMRRVKRLLLNGETPDSMVIAVRDMERYHAPLRTAARRYGIPIAMRGEPMIENPAIAALVALLDLHASDFPRRDLIDVLASPYTNAGFAPDEVDRLDQHARAAYVTLGREALIGCIRALPLESIDADDDEDREITAAPPLDEAAAADLRARLTRFFDGITPPPSASFPDFVCWLETLIGDDDAKHDPDDAPDEPDSVDAPPFTLAVPPRIRASASPYDVIARDLAAMSDLKQLLARLIAAHHLIDTIDQEREAEITWVDFWAEIKRVIAAALTHGDTDAPARHGRVLITSVADARGLPHAHVFVPGLSEGVFPAPTPEDPLLLDGERRRFCDLGVPLRTTEDQGDDDGLFYELINLASHSLTLSRFTTADGSPVLESHLWRGVTAILPDSAQIHFQPGQAVSADDAADMSEAMIAAADIQHGASAAAWLKSAHPERWSQLERGWQVERVRLSAGHAHDRYSGVITHPALKAHLEQVLGADRVWSASQLSDYGKCPFRFFSRRLLKLEKRQDPEMGMDNRQYGNIVHALLEKVYARIERITPAAASDAFRIIDEEAAALLPTAPERFKFTRSVLWREEAAAIVRQVKRLVKADLDDRFVGKKFKLDGERRPYKLETPFSADGAIRLQIGDVTIRVRGYIDRIDRIHTDDGDTLIVIDYKTGTTPIRNQEIERGRVFQMMIYVLAAQEMIRSEVEPLDLAGGLFVHVSNEETSGVLKMNEHSAVIEQGIAHLTRQLAAGRAGNFAARASAAREGLCDSGCDYQQFCRMAITHRKKALPS